MSHSVIRCGQTFALWRAALCRRRVAGSCDLLGLWSLWRMRTGRWRPPLDPQRQAPINAGYRRTPFGRFIHFIAGNPVMPLVTFGRGLSSCRHFADLLEQQQRHRVLCRIRARAGHRLCARARQPVDRKKDDLVPRPKRSCCAPRRRHGLCLCRRRRAQHQYRRRRAPRRHHRAGSVRNDPLGRARAPVTIRARLWDARSAIRP